MADGNGHNTDGNGHEPAEEAAGRTGDGKFANGNEIGKATQFGPNNSANLSGRPKRKPITDALSELLKGDVTDKDGNVHARLDILVEAWFKYAVTGRAEYMKAILDRIEGKLIQALEIDADIGVEFIAQLRERAKQPGHLSSLMQVLKESHALPAEDDTKEHDGNGAKDNGGVGAA